MEKKIKLLAVVGPTASGKSSLAVNLAKALDGEIISCDSMQIYQNMDIGTAKITSEEMQGIKHHLMGFLEENTPFSVSDYVSMADEKILKISAQDKLPILVGGTGLYARSLLYGVDFAKNSRSEKLRKTLFEEIAKGNSAALYEKLQKLDPKAAENIHPNNTKRLARALEYCMTTGELFSDQSVIQPENPKYDFLMLCIGFQDRNVLYERINTRVDKMLADGLLEEARAYYLKTNAIATSQQAIGYKELYPYFSGEIPLKTAIDHMKQETRHYAKRQLTWFKREQNVQWLYADEYQDESQLFCRALALSKTFLSGELKGIYPKNEQPTY